MTYYEITVKLKDLMMTPDDWSWLNKYLIEKTYASHVYEELVKAYQAREECRCLVCKADCGLCRFCGHNFKCGYRGFCANQGS